MTTVQELVEQESKNAMREILRFGYVHPDSVPKAEEVIQAAMNRVIVRLPKNELKSDD